MDTKKFALVWGILFLLIAASGVIPGLWQPAGPEHPDLAVDAMHGDAAGLFPVNILHNLIHAGVRRVGHPGRPQLGLGQDLRRSVAIIYAVFMIMGLIPGLDTTFGLVPLHGNDVWLHLLLFAPAAYFGFMHRDSRADAHRA
jgi:hypothetical protein